MADLSTKYMGIEMRSPVMMGASSFSKKTDNIKKAEDAGAGGVVIHSLFQEQIELEAQELNDALMIGSERFPESITYFPMLNDSGSKEHVMWVEKARKAVSIPIWGSINATSPGSWSAYAKELESAGCDALELNIYSVEADEDISSSEIESRTLDAIGSVVSSVRIPVAFKMSPWYTSVSNMAGRAAEAGAKGIVMFNRFYQPQIDAERESLKIDLDFSRPEDTRLPLRWIAIMSGKTGADLAASTGVHSGRDAVKHLLAGASAVQVVSALYLNKIEHISVMNNEISKWMDERYYRDIEGFRGKLSKQHIEDPYAFERAQYIRLLLGRD